MKQLVIAASILLLGLSNSSFAIQLSPQDPPARPRQAKPAQKPADKVEENTPGEQPDDAMRRAISGLSTQINLLNEEISKLRLETERSSGILELLLNEERLAKLDDKIQETTNQKAQLDAREQEIQRRMRNIPAEASLRGGLRREEAEAAVRSELQRALDDTRSQQASSHQRLGELVEQSTRIRNRLEKLRKKLEQPEEIDKDKE